MKQLFTFICILFCIDLFPQTNCAFVKDSVFIPKEAKTKSVELLQATFKNRTIVQLIKAPGAKYFLKLVVFENLYFDKVDVLEIVSGSMSIYNKDIKQFQLDKYTGFYVVEVGKNYIATLRDNGITSIVFGKAETDFTKTDCNQVKQIAGCFYQSIAGKK